MNKRNKPIFAFLRLSPILLGLMINSAVAATVSLPSATFLSFDPPCVGYAAKETVLSPSTSDVEVLKNCDVENPPPAVGSLIPKAWFSSRIQYRLDCAMRQFAIIKQIYYAKQFWLDEIRAKPQKDPPPPDYVDFVDSGVMLLPLFQKVCRETEP